MSLHMTLVNESRRMQGKIVQTENVSRDDSENVLRDHLWRSI